MRLWKLSLPHLNRVAFGLLQISFGQTKGHPFVDGWYGRIMQPGLIEPGCYTKGSRGATMEAIASSPESRGFWPAPNFIWADKRPPVQVAFRIIRHLASFPQSSIIAPTRLDFCVRNENRYFPSGMDTEVRFKVAHAKTVWVRCSFESRLDVRCYRNGILIDSSTF